MRRPSTRDDATEACREEILELHRFFQDWVLGVLPNDDEAFARLTGVLTNGFAIVSPDGRIDRREALVEGIRARHGAERDRGYRIWIENVQLRTTKNQLHIVVYEEWQETEGSVKGRLSTAILIDRKGTPNGVAWMHVHETWLP